MGTKRAWCFKITGFFLNIAVLGLAAYGLYDIIVSYTGTKYFGVGTGCISQCLTTTPFQKSCTSNTSAGTNATTTFIIDRGVVISNININAKTILILIFVLQLAFAVLSIIMIILLKYQLYTTGKKTWQKHAIIVLLAVSDTVLAIAGIGLVVIPIIYLARFGTNSITFLPFGSMYVQFQCDTTISFNKAHAESSNPPGFLCSTFNISSFSYFAGNSPSNQTEYISLDYFYSGDDPVCYNAEGTQCIGNNCTSNVVVGGQLAKLDVYNAFHNNLVRGVAFSVSAMTLGVIALILELADGW